MNVLIAFSPGPGEVDEEWLQLPSGTLLGRALALSELIRRHSQVDVATARIGIWGKLRTLDFVLRDRDRVEIYRPLQVDPKEARRLRYRKHRERFKT